MPNFIEVYCSLRDCLYYTPDPATTAKCHCIHPDKSHYMANATCPLYRMDWKKKAVDANAPKRMKPR